MARGTGVNGGTPATDVLCDVRRYVERAHVGDECRCVVTLVGAQGDATARV
jgi:hypothetical protein